jgi:uncharacterized protein (TIGR02246 family)
MNRGVEQIGKFMSGGEAAEHIALDFIARYEAAWAQGARAAAELYTADSVLVGYMTAVGRAEIEKLLAGIIDHGWTQIKMRPVNVRRIGEVILLACAYTAIGSGANAGKTLDATSSHVLVRADGVWRSALHTAR